LKGLGLRRPRPGKDLSRGAAGPDPLRWACGLRGGRGGPDCAVGQLVPRRGTGIVSRPGASTIWPPDTAAPCRWAVLQGQPKTSALQAL